MIVSFFLLGLGKALPNKFLTEAEEANAEIRATGRYLLLVSDHYPMRRFFQFCISDAIFFCKTKKNKGRHQAKDHAQVFMLRDSFLDLIPALCFRIHRREDGSLCQNILFLCGDSAINGKIVKRNDRRSSVPTQNVFALTLWTDDRKICGR